MLSDGYSQTVQRPTAFRFHGWSIPKQIYELLLALDVHFHQ